MINYSFIIPHKNCPDLLQRCVDSIPERDDVQIIVVDDNSNEGKKPQISRKGVEVILLDAECSKGAGRARNVGLEHAKGRWLLFADSDDYYNSGFLGVLDKYVNSDCDVVYFNFDFKDGKTGEDLPALRFKSYFDYYNGSKECRDQIKFHHNVPWTKMVSHDYIIENNIYFEETLNGNDIFFSMMVGLFTEKIAVEKKALYVYLRNENSILTSKPTVQGALCKIEHRLKLNSFYSSISHSKWERSSFRMIVDYTIKIGLPFLFGLIARTPVLYKKRKEWAQIISNHNRKVNTI